MASRSYRFVLKQALAAFVLVFLSFGAIAQNDSTKTRKYRLALPDQWMGKRSVLDQLITVAPSVFTRLGDKQFCLKCKTPYTLMLFYDSLVVESRVATFKNSVTEYRFGKQQEIEKYECITTYRFKATWTLLYKDSAIAELDLVLPSEKITTVKNFSMKNNTVILSSLQKRPQKVEYSIFDDPRLFVNKYPESFDPTVEDILAVILQRIGNIDTK